MFFHPSKLEHDDVKHVFMVFHNIEARFCVCSPHGHHIMYLWFLYVWQTRLTICEGRDGTESSNGDVMIFPDMVRYK